MYSDDKVLYLLRLWGKRNSGSKIRWWNKNRNIEIISKSLPFNQFNPKSKRHRIDRNLGKFQDLGEFCFDLVWQVATIQLWVTQPFQGREFYCSNNDLYLSCLRNLLKKIQRFPWLVKWYVWFCFFLQRNIFDRR